MAIVRAEGPAREFGTGAHKQAAAGKGTPVLFPADAYMEVAKHFEEGAEVHGARNWEKGIPLSELINSLERHIAAEKMGQTDERHDRALAWNAIVYLATKLRIQRGILPKSLNDMPRYLVLDPACSLPAVAESLKTRTCGECDHPLCYSHNTHSDRNATTFSCFVPKGGA